MNDRIIAHLPGNFPWQVHWLKTVDSTNDLAKKMAGDGAPHGTVILADHQTKGRGRLGRSFESPDQKGIYLSLILRPGCQIQRLMHLTCAVGTAMCDAVENVTGFRPGTKWINDLVAHGKKLGGILTELRTDAYGTVEYAVVGIGINCQRAQMSAQLTDIAICLESVAGTCVDRTALAAAMVLALYRMDQRLLTEKDAIMAAYRADCVTLGKAIKVLRGDSTVPATALDVNDDGALLVRYCDDTTGLINSGEVSVRGLWGYC